MGRHINKAHREAPNDSNKFEESNMWLETMHPDLLKLNVIIILLNEKLDFETIYTPYLGEMSLHNFKFTVQFKQEKK